MNAASIHTACTLHAALLGAVGPSDPRVHALDAALITRDAGMLSAALAYVERETPAELTALVAVKARLVEDAAKLAPIFATIVDVPAVAEAGRTSGDVFHDVSRGIVARSAFALCPATTPNGSQLAVRLIFPDGVSGGIVEAVGRALRDLAPGLASSRTAQRTAALAAVSPSPVVPSKK
jgi:hypothetical protein